MEVELEVEVELELELEPEPELEPELGPGLELELGVGVDVEVRVGAEEGGVVGGWTGRLNRPPGRNTTQPHPRICSIWPYRPGLLSERHLPSSPCMGEVDETGPLGTWRRY